MMAVMVMPYTTVLNTKKKNADGWSGHGGGEAEGQWILPPPSLMSNGLHKTLTSVISGPTLGSQES